MGAKAQVLQQVADKLPAVLPAKPTTLAGLSDKAAGPVGKGMGEQTQGKGVLESFLTSFWECVTLGDISFHWFSGHKFSLISRNFVKR